MMKIGPECENCGGEDCACCNVYLEEKAAADAAREEDMREIDRWADSDPF